MSRGPKTELTYMAASRTSDGMGGYDTVYYSGRRIKGVMYSLSGSERLSADKQTVYASKRFVCRKLPGLTIGEDDRFMNEKGGTVYQIKYIDNLSEQDRYLAIDLLEVE